ncbi:MAG: ribonuclease Z [Flavobacteriia bacterium]|jgi:ribonuclease Z
MSFELVILGSGAALPTGKRKPTAQYINCNERHILIDCGEGTQNQLRKFGIKLQKIKYIFISHLHGDHYFGLMGLLSTMNLLGRTQGIKLFAPEPLKEIIDLQLKASGHHYEFNLEFISTNPSEKHLLFEDKIIEIYSFPLKHRIPTTGFLIQEKIKDFTILGEELEEANLSLQAIPFFRRGENYTDQNGKTYLAEDFTLPPKAPKSYAYCSDTAYLESLIDIVQDSNLMYHEATFIEKHKDRAKATLHSTAIQAATIAKKAKVNKLLLGHFSSRYDGTDTHLQEAKTVFENSFAVEDGDRYFI